MQARLRCLCDRGGAFSLSFSSPWEKFPVPRVCDSSTKTRSRQPLQLRIGSDERRSTPNPRERKQAPALPGSSACTGLFLHLLLTPHIEVVIPKLPEGSWSRPVAPKCRTKRTGHPAEFSGSVLLQHLYRDGQASAFRLVDQEMHMFRHDNVASYEKTVPAAHRFKR